MRDSELGDRAVFDGGAGKLSGPRSIGEIQTAQAELEKALSLLYEEIAILQDKLQPIMQQATEGSIPSTDEVQPGSSEVVYTLRDHLSRVRYMCSLVHEISARATC